jgi:hypothetical protein
MTEVDDANRGGERELRRALRIIQTAREEVANILKHARHQMAAEAVAKAEDELRRLDRVMEYGSRALSMLPEEPVERLKALHEAMTILEELSAD